MKTVSYKKIFAILLTSLLLGLAANYFNPKGVQLIREKLELKWAPDSLFNGIDDKSNIPDSRLNSNEKVKVNQSGNKSKIEDTTVKKNENVQPPVKQIKTEEEKPKEVITFLEPKAITLDQAYKLFNSGVLFIDARDQADYAFGHITNSINIPFDDFDNHKQKLDQLSKEKPIVIYCAGTDCDLSHLLANLLFEKGYKQVYVFFGGWNEWLEANYSIDKTTE